MNIILTSLIMCLSTVSLMHGMNLPDAVDQKKLACDKKLLIGGLQNAVAYEGRTLVPLTSPQQRKSSLKLLLGIWKNQIDALSRLDYSFESYLQQSGINHSQWLEQWYQEKHNQPITFLEFGEAVADQLNTGLQKYHPDTKE